MKKRIFSLALIIIFIILVSFLLNKAFNKLYEKRTALNKENEDKLDIEKLVKDKDLGNLEEDELLFLLVGVDENYDSGKKDEMVRTDTMMLFHLNILTGQIDIISIPRDTRTLVDGKINKINAAHSIGGIDLTIKTIRDMMNIDLDYYVKVNFDGVIDVVDTIGGIEYEVPKGINFEYRGVHIHEGKQVLDGLETLMYLRHRSSYATGDVGRINAQQEFIKEVIKQVLNKKNISKIPELLKTIFSKINTNIPFNKLLSLALNADKFDMGNIHSFIMPGTDGSKEGVAYYYINKEGMEDLIDVLLDKFKISSYYDDEKENKEEWEYLYESNHPDVMGENYDPMEYNNEKELEKLRKNKGTKEE